MASNKDKSEEEQRAIAEAKELADRERERVQEAAKRAKNVAAGKTSKGTPRSDRRKRG